MLVRTFESIECLAISDLHYSLYEAVLMLTKSKDYVAGGKGYLVLESTDISLNSPSGQIERYDGVDGYSYEFKDDTNCLLLMALLASMVVAMVVTMPEVAAVPLQWLNGTDSQVSTILVAWCRW